MPCPAVGVLLWIFSGPEEQGRGYPAREALAGPVAEMATFRAAMFAQPLPEFLRIRLRLVL